jgi:hypothetical protein
MLQRLVDAGIVYLFVSNSDNLGATLDVDLLSYFAETDKAFVMEVCLHYCDCLLRPPAQKHLFLFSDTDKSFAQKASCMHAPLPSTVHQS